MSRKKQDARRIGDKAFCAAVAASAQLEVGHMVYSRVPPLFDTGWRRTEWHYLHVVVEGALHGEYADATQTVGAGQAMWTSCDVSHRLTLPADSREPTICYSLRLKVLRRGCPLRPQADRRFVAQAATLRESADRLLLGLREVGPLHGQLRRALILELLVRFLRAADERQRPLGVFDHAHLRTLERYVDSHLAENPGPADLAAALDLSPAYFADRFRLHFGLPPRTWLMRERLRRAALLLLESPMRVQAIAAAVGFSDQRFFSRQFRAHYGRSPRAYRQDH